jgi:PST family polysaccharide transporter
LDFLKKSFWTGFSSLAFAAYSFITNKLFSIYFGPQGVTLLAHFQNLVAIFTTITNEGINRGLIKIFANPDITRKEWNATFTYGLLLTFISFLVILAALFLFNNTFRNDFPPSLFDPLNLIFLIVAVLLHMLGLMFISLLMAMQHIRAFTLLSVLNNMIGLILVYIGLQKGLVTSLIYLCISPASMLVVIVWYYYRSNIERLRNFIWTLDKMAFNQIIQFVFTALASAVLSRVVDFFVRSYLIKSFNPHQTGLWQAIAKISDGYTTIFSAALGILIFTKIASFINDEKKMRIFVRKSLAFTAFTTGIGMMVIYIYIEPIVKTLYSAEFVEGSYLLPFLLLGDWFKFPTWIFGFLLQAHLKTKTFIAAQLISSALYVGLIAILIPYFSLETMPIAHFIRYILYFGLMYYLCRKWI